MTRYRSFQPVLKHLCERRKSETWKQYGRRFNRCQDAYGRILEMRMRIEEANERKLRHA